MAYPSVDLSALAPLSGLPQGFTMPTPDTGGMFGGGKSDRLHNALLAAVAGFMARRSPGVANNIINGLQDAQTLKQRVAMAQQERAQQMQDQIAIHQQERTFDIANPMPGQDDEYTRYLAASGILPGTPEYAQHMARRRDVLENPITMTPYGPMPYSAVAAPRPQVGAVVDDPRAQGGAGQSGPQTFPY